MRHLILLITVIASLLFGAISCGIEDSGYSGNSSANSLSKQDVEVLPAPVSESSHTSTPTVTPTPASDQTSGRVYLDRIIPPCTLITAPDKEPCKDRRQRHVNLGFVATTPPLQHEFYLDEYDNHPYAHELSDSYYLSSYRWTTHIALRGVGLPSTARCEIELAMGHGFVTRANEDPQWSVSDKRAYTVNCYVDFQVQEYIVGKGAPTLTIWVFQFGGASTRDSANLLNIREKFLPQMQDIYEGYEWVFYLLPSKYVSVEVFRSNKAWGVGRDQNRPAEYCGGAEICAYANTPAEVIPLDELQNDTKVRHARLMEKNHGRVRPEPIYADIILDTYELTSFFTQVGAYDHPVATPAAPPIPGENAPYTPGTNVGDPPAGDATVTVPGALDDTATDTPTPTPTATTPPAPLPTDTPTVVPTQAPMPTDTPTTVPTDTPTDTPTPIPTQAPMPTDTPTTVPTDTSTAVPTATSPTQAPLPTDTPSAVPDAAPIAAADMQSYSCFYPFAGSCKGCYSSHNCNYQQ